MSHTNHKKKNSKYFKLIMLETYLSYYYSRIKAKIIWNLHLKVQENSTLWSRLFEAYMSLSIDISHYISIWIN